MPNERTSMSNFQQLIEPYHLAGLRTQPLERSLGSGRRTRMDEFRRGIGGAHLSLRGTHSHDRVASPHTTPGRPG